jgi:hypothetical protein
MAIDPRISMGIQAPNTSQAINIFENALMNAQTRDIRQQQADQAAARAPFEQQLLEGRAGQVPAQQAMLEQQVQQGQNVLDEEGENRIIRSVAEFSPVLRPALESALQSGDTSEAQTLLTARLMDLSSKGINTDQTAEAIQMLRNGDVQGVMNAIDIADNAAATRGLLSRGSSVGQREFENLTKIAQGDPNSDETKAARIKLGLDPRAGMSAAERMALTLGLTSSVAGSQAEIAGAIEEAKQEAKDTSASGAQAIEKGAINIDETKFTNEQKRNDVINAKNARRKEADAAIESIDTLLDGDRFSKAFGKVVTSTPELLRSQESIDAIADVNQIKGLITLESRQKLKGQGTITDSEQKILAQSATVLDNPLISDERARRELRKIKRVFEDASDRNQLKRETKDRIEAEALQPQPTSGFKIISVE